MAAFFASVLDAFESLSLIISLLNSIREQCLCLEYLYVVQMCSCFSSRLRRISLSDMSEVYTYLLEVLSLCPKYSVCSVLAKKERLILTYFKTASSGNYEKQDVYQGESFLVLQSLFKLTSKQKPHRSQLTDVIGKFNNLQHDLRCSERFIFRSGSSFS